MFIVGSPIHERGDQSHAREIIPGQGCKFPEPIKEHKLITQTDLDDCAQAFIDIARNTSMTGQKIQVGKCILNRALQSPKSDTKY